MFDYLLKSSGIQQNIRRILRIVLIIVPLAFAGNIIYVVATSSSDLVGYLANIDLMYLMLAAGLALLPWLGQSVGILIWGRVFKADIRPRDALNAVLASDIGAAITPTMLGGGYAKLAFLIKSGFKAHEATLVTFLGSLVDFVFFAVALPLAVLWTRTWENPHIVAIWRELLSNWPAAIIVSAVLVSTLLIVHKVSSRSKRTIDNSESGLVRRIFRNVGRFKRDLVSASRFVIKNGKGAFLACLLFGGLGWLGRYGAISALVAAFGYQADPVLFFLLQWVVFTTMTMIPTPGAIGGAEVSFALIYNGLIPAAAIPLMTSAWRFVTFYLTVGLASILFAFFQMRPEKSISMETTEIPNEAKILK